MDTMDTMDTPPSFPHICMVWLSICVGLLSALRQIPVSGHVGSTAVLPCDLQRGLTEIPYIRWLIDSDIVFERRGEASYQGEGYEGRVDVPEDELRKGNCSLVLKNLTRTDAAVYTSYQAVRRTKRSVSVGTTLNLISRVNLTVDVRPPKDTERDISPPLTADAGLRCPHQMITVLSVISCLLVQLFYGRT